jgi:hypothetical protein
LCAIFKIDTSNRLSNNYKINEINNYCWGNLTPTLSKGEEAETAKIYETYFLNLVFYLIHFEIFQAKMLIIVVLKNKKTLFFINLLTKSTN